MIAVAMKIATAKILKKNKQISTLFLLSVAFGAQITVSAPDQCILCASCSKNLKLRHKGTYPLKEFNISGLMDLGEWILGFLYSG
jgi:hypothetical protein